MLPLRSRGVFAAGGLQLGFFSRSGVLLPPPTDSLFGMAPKKTKAEPKPLSPEVLAALEGSKSASRDALRSQMVFSAWPIDKHPGLRKTLIPASGTIKKRKISVPRGYRCVRELSASPFLLSDVQCSCSCGFAGAKNTT